MRQLAPVKYYGGFPPSPPSSMVSPHHSQRLASTPHPPRTQPTAHKKPVLLPPAPTAVSASVRVFGIQRLLWSVACRGSYCLPVPLPLSAILGAAVVRCSAFYLPTHTHRTRPLLGLLPAAGSLLVPPPPPCPSPPGAGRLQLSKLLFPFAIGGGAPLTPDVYRLTPRLFAFS